MLKKLRKNFNIYMEAKDYAIRQLVKEIHGELDYIEHYAKKQREKLEELEKLLNDESK